MTYTSNCCPLNAPAEASAVAAGALILLHEAGDLQNALSWGDAWLRVHSDSVQAPDVALVVALTHCDLAAARLDSSAADVLECAEEMKLAASLLHQYESGPMLQQDIQKALVVRLHHTCNAAITWGECIGEGSTAPHHQTLLV